MNKGHTTKTQGLLPVAQLQDIPDGGASAGSVDTADTALALIITRRGDQVSVFLNRCPHTGVSLDWVPGRFMDADNRFLQCAVHGALFRPDDGYCIAGPCAKQALTSLEAAVVDGEVRVKFP